MEDSHENCVISSLVYFPKYMNLLLDCYLTTDFLWCYILYGVCYCLPAHSWIRHSTGTSWFAAISADTCVCIYVRLVSLSDDLSTPECFTDPTVVLVIGFTSCYFISHYFEKCTNTRDFNPYIASCHPLYLLCTHPETGDSGSCIRFSHCV